MSVLNSKMTHHSPPCVVADEHALEFVEPFAVPVLEYCGVWFDIKQTIVLYHVLAVKPRTKNQLMVPFLWQPIVCSCLSVYRPAHPWDPVAPQVLRPPTPPPLPT